MPIGEDTYFVEDLIGSERKKVERLRTKDIYACLALSKQLGLNATIRRQSDGRLLAYKSPLSLASKED